MKMTGQTPIEQRARQKYNRLLKITKNIYRRNYTSKEIQSIHDLFASIDAREYLALCKCRFEDLERLADRPGIEEVLGIQEAGFQIHTRLNRLSSSEDLQKANIYFGCGMNMFGEFARINLSVMPERISRE